MRRRDFLNGSGALLLAGCATYAKKSNLRPGTVGTIFLEGGADPLEMVFPTDIASRSALKKLRPDLVVERGWPVVDDMAFAPELKELHQIHQQGGLAVFIGTGSGLNSRSHFEQRDFLVSGGTRGVGVFARAAREMGLKNDDMSMVNLADWRLPEVSGHSQPLTLDIIKDLMAGKSSEQIVNKYVGAQSPLPLDCNRFAAHTSLEQVCHVRELVARQRTFLQELERHRLLPDERQSYGLSPIGEILAGADQALRAQWDCAFFSGRVSGWDTHCDQKKQIHVLLANLDRAVGAFYRHQIWSPTGRDTALMIFSEFGRGLVQNSSGGTEHGLGGITMVLAHPQRLRRHRDRLSLPRKNLDQPDLPVQHSHFDILGELLISFSGLNKRSLAQIFPGRDINTLDFT